MFCRSNHVLIPDNVKHFDSDYCISGITLLIIITSLFQVNISLFTQLFSSFLLRRWFSIQNSQLVYQKKLKV